MRYDTIPTELTQLPQWVCAWKNSKIPMQAKFKKGASSVSPDTWSTYEEAKAAVERGAYDYLGFVFNNNGIIGIDVDCGYDEDGFLSEASIDIMRACRSYTEQSRSGRGIHIYLKGELPFKGKNNRAGVEIYRSSRFFIVTGEKLIYDHITENQEAIDYVVKKYFPEAEKENTGTGLTNRIYSPCYSKPEKGKISIQPTYPPIPQGMRNLSLTSLAGQLHNQGYKKQEIYKELLKANQAACKPPLPVGVFIGLTVAYIIIYIKYDKFDKKDVRGVWYAIFGITLILLIADIRFSKVDAIQCTIEDYVSINEVYDKYDVIDKQGEIWTLRKKTNEET